MKSFALLFPLLFISMPTLAYTPAEGNITGTFGPFYTRTNAKGDAVGSTAPDLGGFGIIAVGDINDRSSLEIAMMYMQKVYVRESAGLYLSEQTQLMHITMGYRRWFSSLFSASLAFSSGYAMDTPTIVHSDFPKGQEIDTSARDKTEYGLDFALQYELWSRDRDALVTDLRYFLSVTPKQSERADHYALMIGFRHLFQEKHSPKKK